MVQQRVVDQAIQLEQPLVVTDQLFKRTPVAGAEPISANVFGHLSHEAGHGVEEPEVVFILVLIF